MLKPAQFLFRILPWAVLFCWGIWLLGVVGHGLGWNLWGGRVPNFETAGQFGDAFGPVASLMATLAACGVFLTLSQQRQENAEQQRLIDENRRRIQVQDFESTFFRLLDVLINKTDRIDLIVNNENNGLGAVTVHGSDAFNQYKSAIENKIIEFDADEQVGNYYLDEFKIREGDLGHYFRLVYTILRYIDDTVNLSNFSERYSYARILRAQLSNPELLIILLNCLYGQGEEKFLPLAIRYDLFQHLGESSDQLNTRMFAALQSRVQHLNIAFGREQGRAELTV